MIGEFVLLIADEILHTARIGELIGSNRRKCRFRPLQIKLPLHPTRIHPQARTAVYMSFFESISKYWCSLVHLIPILINRHHVAARIARAIGDMLRKRRLSIHDIFCYSIASRKIGIEISKISPSEKIKIFRTSHHTQTSNYLSARSYESYFYSHETPLVPILGKT